MLSTQIETFLSQANSIAVVGNAQSLLRLGLGEEIDSHEVVVRFNDGVLCPNPEHQGTRTDVGCFCKLMGRFLQLAESCKNGARVVHCSNLGRELIRDKFAYIPTAANTTLIQQLGLKWPDGRPSSGIAFLNYLLLHVGVACPVNIYGFDWRDTPTYYNGKGKTATGKQSHQWELEREFVHNNILSLPNVRIRDRVET